MLLRIHMPSRIFDRPGPILGVLLLAVATRAIALVKFHELRGDPDGYRAVAENLVAGKGFGFPQPPYIQGAPSAYRPPLYPLLLAPAIALAGDRQQATQLFIGAMQLVFGVASVGFVVLAGRNLGLGRAASLAAGTLMALDPLLIYSTGLVMTEATATFLVSLLIWLSSRAAGLGARFASGLVFGLCCLCRPTFWAFGMLVAVGWVARRVVEQRGIAGSTAPALRENCVSGLTVVLGLLLAVTPWVARNAISMGQPILTTTHGGYTLLLPHNPVYTQEVIESETGNAWNGESLTAWQNELEREMSLESPPIGYRQETPAIELARDRWMSRRAWHYICERPVIACRAGLTLLRRFWGIAPSTAEAQPITAVARWSIGAFYSVQFALMLVGLYRLRRNDWSAWWPLAALLISFTVVHALYWADMRMRAPIVPAIALFAARALPRPIE